MIPPALLIAGLEGGLMPHGRKTPSTPINLTMFLRMTRFQLENDGLPFNSYVVEGTLGSFSSHNFNYYCFLLKYQLLWMNRKWNNAEEEHSIIIVGLNNSTQRLPPGALGPAYEWVPFQKFSGTWNQLSTGNRNGH